MARAKLGEILVQRGVIDAATLKRALGEQVRFAAQKFRLGQILVDMKACGWADVASAISLQQGVPLADLSKVDGAAVKLLAVELCEKHRAVAYGREVGPPDVVKVAFADPADLAAVDAVRFRLGKPMRAAIGAADAIQQVIDRELKGITVASGSFELDSDLFGDSADALSVDHFESGDLQTPGFAPVPDAPAPAVPTIGVSNEASFDALFGDAPTQPPRPTTPPPLEAEPEPLVAHTPPVAVTRFPDTRPRQPPQPPPPSLASPPTKPTLVLTADALFPPTPPPPPEEVLLTGDAMDVVEAMPPPPLPAKEALFASSFDATDHVDPMHPVHTAEPGAAQELFGSSYESGPHTGELQLDPALLEGELEAPNTLAAPDAADVSLDDLGEMEALDAALEEQPLPAPAEVAPPPEPEVTEPELLPAPEITEPELVEPELSPAASEDPEPELPELIEEEPPAEAEAPRAPEAVAVAAPVVAREVEGLATFADRPLTAEELAVIGVIEQLADGLIEDAPIKQAKPAHMIAALVRLLIRQGVIRETEFLEELTRK
jgi:hypothetical protein